MLVQLALIVVLIAGNFLFVAAEFSITRIRPTGLAFAPPMRLFYIATKPIVDLLNWLANLVLRPFGIPPASEAGHAPTARTSRASWSGRAARRHDRPRRARVHAKDLLRASGRDGEASLRDLARPLHRVPDGVLLDELLESLRRDRQHLALVVDEHDTAVGVITLEDVLEEIVGEIEDEFDSEADEATVGERRVPADGEEAR